VWRWRWHTRPFTFVSEVAVRVIQLCCQQLLLRQQPFDARHLGR
jgi:hypothetical protein